MDYGDYEKFLIESSFKESNLFWIRNSAYSIIHIMFIGFVLNYFINSSDTKNNIFLLIICFIGIFIGILHILNNIVSYHYNHAWLDSAINWAKINSKINNKNKKMFTHLTKHFEEHEKLPFGKNATQYANYLPILIIIMWFILILLVVF